MTITSKTSASPAPRRRRAVAIGLAAALAAAPSLAAPPKAPQVSDDGTRIAAPIASFSGLDKITGRIISFDVAIDETVQFGALQVTPRVCYARPQTVAPLTTSFVEVDEITLDNKIRRIFTGWMFADSPGLHAVEHAVYDVWLTDCRSQTADAAAGAKAGIGTTAPGAPAQAPSDTTTVAPKAAPKPADAAPAAPKPAAPKPAPSPAATAPGAPPAAPRPPAPAAPKPVAAPQAPVAPAPLPGGPLPTRSELPPLQPVMPSR